MRGILLSILSLMILQSCLTPKKIIKIEEKAIQFLAESKPEYDFIFLYKNLFYLNFFLLIFLLAGQGKIKSGFQFLKIFFFWVEAFFLKKTKFLILRL